MSTSISSHSLESSLAADIFSINLSISCHLSKLSCLSCDVFLFFVFAFIFYNIFFSIFCLYIKLSYTYTK